MRHDQADRYERNLTVKMINDVFAPWLGDVPEARGKTELQAHHRKAGIAEGDRELCPEITRRRMRAGQQCEQGSENEQQVDENPNGPAQTIKKLHKLLLLPGSQSGDTVTIAWRNLAVSRTKSSSKKISTNDISVANPRANGMSHRD